MSEPLHTTGETPRDSRDSGAHHTSAPTPTVDATQRADAYPTPTTSASTPTDAYPTNQHRPTGTDPEPLFDVTSSNNVRTGRDTLRTVERTARDSGAHHGTPTVPQGDTVRTGRDTYAPDETPAVPQRTTVRTNAPHRNGETTMSGGKDRTDAKYLSVPQAASYLGTTERFIRRIVAERRIVFYKVGRHVRFSVGDLEAFAQAGRVEPISVTWHGGQVGA
ncbi:helix-turn-helix domain-containing protein [Nocardia sp. NPDC005366]|uniref:helix-turn-helix domain-containing protein n=1 Tax=Nocardia sp. NPDC005366 TaxID=3156878 RepID=UPI0033B1B1A7